MESQEKKAWLKSYRAMGQEVQRAQEEMEQWRARATKITQSCSGMPGFGGESADNIPKCVAKIIELEKELDDKLDEMLDRRREIEAAIDNLPDTTQRQMLKLRYINGKTLEQVAVCMSYSYMQICRIHGRALQDLDPKIDERL